MSFVRRAALAAALVTGAFAGLALSGVAQDGAKPAAPKPAAPKQDAPKADAKKDEVIVPFFGNEKCPVTGKAVDKNQSVEVDGQRVYTCCKNCVPKVKADFKGMVAIAYKDAKKIDNKTCPVSGHPIAGDKVKAMTWQGHTLSLCCGDCEKAFLKEPLIMVAKAQYGAEDLKNAKCPIQNDQDFDGEHIVIYKGKIVRMCCPDCPADFQKDPAKAFAKAGGK
jgi:YHS domain-containing protein